MENIHRMRNSYLSMIIESYTNSLADTSVNEINRYASNGTYRLSKEEYDILAKIEIKLYNNVITYKREYDGEFKLLYNQLILELCESMSINIPELTIVQDISIAEAIQGSLINPKDIKKYFNIKPKYNPREICKNAIAHELSKNFDDYVAIAEVIETSCYNYVTKYCRDSNQLYQIRWDYTPFIRRYEDRISIILNHLNTDTITNKFYGNTVINKLKNCEITPEDIGFMEDSELCPAAIAKELEEIEIRNNQKIIQKHSTLYKCPLCHVRQCTFRSVQIAASDEPAHIMCLCLNCGNKFRGH